MAKENILEQLNQYVPTSSTDRESLLRTQKFIKDNDFCFNAEHPPARGREQDTEKGHVTGSAWLVSPDKKSVLLTHHKKLSKWLQLGGHSDDEPNVLLTALREAKEESGINDIELLSKEIFDVDVHVFPKKREVEAHLHYDIRFAFVAKTLDFAVSDESNELKWVSIGEILQNGDLFEESIQRMAKKFSESMGS